MNRLQVGRINRCWDTETDNRLTPICEYAVLCNDTSLGNEYVGSGGFTDSRIQRQDISTKHGGAATALMDLELANDEGFSLTAISDQVVRS